MAEKVFRAAGDGAHEEVQLPEYVCHKHVFAAKILSVAHLAAGQTYRLALEGPAFVDVSRTWIQTKAPIAGGYYVQYGDGYSSYSPAEAFEEGYAEFPLDIRTGVQPLKDEEVYALVRKSLIDGQGASVPEGATVAQFESAVSEIFANQAQIILNYQEIERESLAEITELKMKLEMALPAVQVKDIADRDGRIDNLSKPSAADLDAVAEEQKAAEATAGSSSGTSLSDASASPAPDSSAEAISDPPDSSCPEVPGEPPAAEA